MTTKLPRNIVTFLDKIYWLAACYPPASLSNTGLQVKSIDVRDGGWWRGRGGASVCEDCEKRVREVVLLRAEKVIVYFVVLKLNKASPSELSLVSDVSVKRYNIINIKLASNAIA